MDMTLIYARISDRTVADEYFKVTEAVEANYRRMSPLPDIAGTTDAVTHPTDHRRLLANGHCTRPALLDCAFESVCERCGFFESGPKFVTSSAASSRESPRPIECASMGLSPGPTDHLYNSGSGIDIWLGRLLTPASGREITLSERSGRRLGTPDRRFPDGGLGAPFVSETIPAT